MARNLSLFSKLGLPKGGRLKLVVSEAVRGHEGVVVHQRRRREELALGGHAKCLKVEHGAVRGAVLEVVAVALRVEGAMVGELLQGPEVGATAYVKSEVITL